MSDTIEGIWTIVLTGYPKSGKTTLARKLVDDHQNITRISTDELRSMLFNETPPCRDEYLIYSTIAEMRDTLLRKGYSVVIDSTAPDNITRNFLLTTKIKHLNQLLIVLTAERETLRKRNLETFGNETRIFAWDKRWEEPNRECCLFKFKSNNIKEFTDYYARLKELLESEMHPFRPEFRHPILPLKEIQKSLKTFLKRR